MKEMMKEIVAAVNSGNMDYASHLSNCYGKQMHELRTEELLQNNDEGDTLIIETPEDTTSLVYDATPYPIDPSTEKFWTLWIEQLNYIGRLQEDIARSTGETRKAWKKELVEGIINLRKLKNGEILDV